MRNWLLERLLRKNLSSEKGRMELQRMLQSAVDEHYTEQTVPGNIYNNFCEFVMSNEELRYAVKTNSGNYTEMIRKGLLKEYYRGLGQIKKEKLWNQ